MSIDVDLLSRQTGVSVERIEMLMDKHCVSGLPAVRSPTDGLQAFYSDLTALHCEDPTLTQQHLAAETDINYIVDRFTRTGEMPQGPEPRFGDISDFPSDFHAALNQVNSAREAFMELPAAVRSRFANDPGQLLDFVGNDDNYDEAVRLGLVPPKEDLSTAGARPKEAGEPAVGKSGKHAKAAVRASNDVLEGDEGDD